MSKIINDAKLCLEQGIQILETLNSDVYSKSIDSMSNQSIGAHIRHNIDHFLSFFKGIHGTYIDYDQRDRNAKIEEDSSYTIEIFRNLIQKLDTIQDKDLDTEISVKMDSGDTSDLASSSIRRELQFLISHTIHHYALISLLCKIMAIPTVENFGIAPSTLKHREKLQLCAH